MKNLSVVRWSVFLVLVMLFAPIVYGDDEQPAMEGSSYLLSLDDMSEVSGGCIQTYFECKGLDPCDGWQVNGDGRLIGCIPNPSDWESLGIPAYQVTCSGTCFYCTGGNLERGCVSTEDEMPDCITLSEQNTCGDKTENACSGRWKQGCDCGTNTGGNEDCKINDCTQGS